MLTVYDAAEGALVARDPALASAKTAVWIDLLKPFQGEGPSGRAGRSTRSPRTRRCARSRPRAATFRGRRPLHDGRRAAPAGCGGGSPPSPRRSRSCSRAASSITVRYGEPRAFSIFLGRAQKKDAACMSGAAVLVGLLEAVIDREADRVERIQVEVDQLSQTIFGTRGGERTRTRRFDVNIRDHRPGGRAHLVFAREPAFPRSDS